MSQEKKMPPSRLQVRTTVHHITKVPKKNVWIASRIACKVRNDYKSPKFNSSYADCRCDHDHDMIMNFHLPFSFLRSSAWENGIMLCPTSQTNDDNNATLQDEDDTTAEKFILCHCHKDKYYSKSKSSLPHTYIDSYIVYIFTLSSSASYFMWHS